MQLRSGRTTLNHEKNTEISLIKELITTVDKTIDELLDEHKKKPVSLDINNLKHTLTLFQTMRATVYQNVRDDNTASGDRFALISYATTLRLMGDIIKYTYTHASLDYSDYTKGLFVKTIYELREAFLITRTILSHRKCESDYIEKLLQISIDQKGQQISDARSWEARAYYCYRHFYKSNEANNYDIGSYANGNYTDVEIYDYYFKGNAGKDVNSDLLINEDYKKWFPDEKDIYDTTVYNIIEPAVIPQLITLSELKHHIDFHKTELEKYEDMLDDLEYKNNNNNNSEEESGGGVCGAV